MRTGSLHKYRALRNPGARRPTLCDRYESRRGLTLNVLDFSISEAVFRVRGKGGRDRLAFIVDDQSLRIQQEHIEMRSHIASESQALFLNEQLDASQHKA